MPYCTNCGKANPEDARFCSQCGTRLVSDEGQAPPAADSTATISIGRMTVQRRSMRKSLHSTFEVVRHRKHESPARTVRRLR